MIISAWPGFGRWCRDLAMGRWRHAGRGCTEVCMLIGVCLDEGSLGAPRVLTPELRAALAEPGTVVVDAWEFANLGLKGSSYEAGEINGQPVRLVSSIAPNPKVTVPGDLPIVEALLRKTPEARVEEPAV